MLFLLLAGFAAGKPWNACTADKRSFKFCDEALPLEERVQDLAQRVPCGDITLPRCVGFDSE